RAGGKRRRRCRLQNGIRQRCAGRLLPATMYPLRPAGPGAAAPELAGGPQLAAAAGGGINAVMGVDDPAGPGGDSGTAGIDGPLAAAPIAGARSDSAPGEPRAGWQAAGESEPGTGQGGVAAGSGRPPKAAGEEG